MTRSAETKSDFWSRRRARVEAEQTAETQALAAQQLAQEHAKLEEKTDAELLAELNLPDPEEMQQGDDFSVFMSSAVPDRLRRRALRKLWVSNPVLACVDGLVDYGEDFTDAAMCVPDMKTAYQVGKGMLKHVQAMAEQAEAKAKAAQADEALVATQDIAPEIEATALTAQQEADQQDTNAYDATAFAEPAAEPAMARRRMRFDFEQTESA